VIKPSGPMTDLNGNVIQDASGHIGFPGFDGMEATVSLSWVAQMQEAGVPVTYAYISDAHDGHGTAGNIHFAYGPGEAGYVQQLHDYDTAFQKFFDRLAADGIRLVAKTSHDGGATFTDHVRIDHATPSEPADMRTGGLPSVTVDPLTGHLFAVWQDVRFRTDGLNDVVITRSVNGGRSWLFLGRVNAESALQLRDNFTPDVAARGGRVFVTYRTRSNRDGPSLFVDERFVPSPDDGRSFNGELVLGPAADLRYAARRLLQAPGFTAITAPSAATGLSATCRPGNRAVSSCRRVSSFSTTATSYGGSTSAANTSWSTFASVVTPRRWRWPLRTTTGWSVAGNTDGVGARMPRCPE